MKRNYILIVVWLLANLFAGSAQTKEALSAKGLCQVTITVDKASHVKAVTAAGNGTVLSLTDGENSLTLDDSENPLQIEPADGASIVSVVQNGSKKQPSGDGKYRLGISDGMTLEITTRSLSIDPAVTFSVDNPLHIVVKADGISVPDISSPVTFAKGTLLTITAAAGYGIKTLSASNVPTVPLIDGAYTLTINADVTIYVTTQAVDPVVTFDIDYPARVTVLNMETRQPVDISSSEVSVPAGTVLEILAAGADYTIKSLTVNGVEKQPSGGSGIYHVGISANTTIAIRTSSVIPSVRFVVDNPENVKVHLLDSDVALDLSRTHEFEKNTQIVIEPASNEIRIASVVANGFKLTPLKDGTYMTSVSTDMTIEIKTKGLLPELTFYVDTPERIRVLNGSEALDISNPVEVPEGTQITIEPASDNFLIRSVVANGNTLTVDADRKYRVTVSGDMEFTVETAAHLTLHIVQPDGGTVSVFREDRELHEGDRVMTGEVLLFKNVADEGYVFLSYLVKGEECIDTYTVSGSEDITVSADFRAIREGYALITFDMDKLATELINVSVYEDSLWTKIDPTQLCEIKKGSKIQIYIFTVSVFISSCTMNGVEMTPEEGKENKSYEGTIEDNAVIKIRTEQRVNVVGSITFEPVTQAEMGRTYIKYNGETETSLIVPIGATVEIVAVPAQGYELDYLYLSVPENRIEGMTYTIENGDREILLFKGAFKKSGSGINQVNTLQSHYDAESMQIVTTGGITQVYSLSGERVIESAGTNISVSALRSGMYIVKTQDGVFKIVKK